MGRTHIESVPRLVSLYYHFRQKIVNGFGIDLSLNS